MLWLLKENKIAVEEWHNIIIIMTFYMQFR